MRCGFVGIAISLVFTGTGGSLADDYMPAFEYDEYHGECGRYSGNYVPGGKCQESSADNQMLAEMLFAGFLIHSQQQLAASAEASGPLLHPSEAQYSQAAPLLAGKTLLINGGQPIYFAANGIAAAEDPNTGQRYRWDWGVRGNNACLMFADGGLGCFEFKFSKKKKLAGIVDSDGKLSENFQILGADIMGFSSITG